MCLKKCQQAWILLNCTEEYSDIIDRLDKLEGNIDEVSWSMGMPIMTDMWLQMFLTLLQTQEFQHLLANMFAQLFKTFKRWG